MIENSAPDTSATLRVRDADLLDVERQHRPEAAIDELQPEDHAHHQDEIAERQHVAERHASGLGRVGRLRVRGAIVVHDVDDHQGDQRRTSPSRRTRGAGRRACARRPPITGPTPGTDALRGLHRADRRRHAVARRRLGRHRHRQRSVAGEQPLDRAQRQHLPDAGDERHRREQHDEADQRSLDHDLAAEAIAEPSPGRRQHRRQPRRHAEAQPGPHRDLADVADAELADEQRQERHHEREAGVAHERRGGDGEDVAPPGADERVDVLQRPVSAAVGRA